jgi:hypothetical protein
MTSPKRWIVQMRDAPDGSGDGIVQLPDGVWKELAAQAKKLGMYSTMTRCPSLVQWSSGITVRNVAGREREGDRRPTLIIPVISVAFNG